MAVFYPINSCLYVYSDTVYQGLGRLPAGGEWLQSALWEMWDWGRREEYTHTKYTHTHRNPCTQIVGLEAGYLGIACICEADEEQQ